MAEIKDKIVTVESLKAVYDSLNESKAPSGFGLGETTTKYFPASESELDTMLTEVVDKLPNESVGFYTFVDNVGSVFGGGTAHATVYRANEHYTTVTFVKCHYTSVSKFVKTLYNDSWLPISWETPPMIIGEEYRTTEKYNGEAVYVKLVDIGALPNNTERTVENFVSNVKSLVDASLVYGHTNGAYPMYTGKAQDINWYVSAYSDGKAFLIIKTTSDLSANKGYLTLKYTKK